MEGEPNDDLVHQVLIQRGPRSLRWIGLRALVSVIGVGTVVACALTRTEGEPDVVGIVLARPFAAAAARGIIWRGLRRHQRRSSRG